MTFVNSVEQEGRTLLARWYAEGAQLIAKSKASRELAEAIIGEPLPEFAAAGSAGAGWTWLPFHTSFGAAKLNLTVLLAALLLPVQSHAANLKAETVAAWDDYVQSVSVTLQDRGRRSRRDSQSLGSRIEERAHLLGQPRIRVPWARSDCMAAAINRARTFA
jgi:hypothetical protein